MLLYIETIVVYWWGTVAEAVCMYSETLAQDTKLELHCKIKTVKKTLI